MTDEMIALRSMLEKGRDADVLREMIGFAAGRGSDPGAIELWDWRERK